MGQRCRGWDRPGPDSHGELVPEIVVELRVRPPRTKSITTVEASMRLDAIASAGFSVSGGPSEESPSMNREELAGGYLPIEIFSRN